MVSPTLRTTDISVEPPHFWPTIGVGFDITIMPTHVYISVWDNDAGQRHLTVRPTAGCGISFNINARLSRLSWEVADNHLDLAAAIDASWKSEKQNLPEKWRLLF